MSRELDYACARALGIEGAVNGRPCYFVPGHVQALLLPPEFSESQDWARLLEDEIEKRGLQERYIDALDSLVTYERTEGWKWFRWGILRATPEQRCRAFLEAMRP